MEMCLECKEAWPLDRFIEDSPICFRCRIQGVGFHFGAGGKEGKKEFHDVTRKEFLDRQFKESKKNGFDIVPVHTATTAAPTSQMFANLKSASEKAIPTVAQKVAP